jgi:hypothetical protein
MHRTAMPVSQTRQRRFPPPESQIPAFSAVIKHDVPHRGVN